MLLIAAAGNGGNSGKLYPASYPNVMSVGAIDVNNNIAGFSQYNDAVDISGPGVQVKSTTGSSGYSTYSGTFMATPHVSGVALLLWNTFPACRNVEIRNAIEMSAEDLGDTGRDDYFGHGAVKYWAAYDYLSLRGCGEKKTIAPSPTSAPTECEGSTFKLSLVTDDYGLETTWKIGNNEGETVFQGEGYKNTEVTVVEECLPVDVCTFTISDEYGDGICCGHGEGSFTVFIDDVLIKTGGDFGANQVVDLCASTAAPTNSPTESVSLSPTNSPTESVSLSPTNSPTESVSLSPTNSPTESVSLWPTSTPVSTCKNKTNNLRWKNAFGRRGCRWVSRDPKERCKTVGRIANTEVRARDACCIECSSVA